MKLKIANEYGNVSTDSIPRGYVHVAGNRLAAICDKLGIKYCKAVVGFQGTKRYGYSPIFGGVVISSRSEAKLRQAIAERDERLAATAEKRAAAKERRQARQAAKLAEAEQTALDLGIPLCSRTAQWLASGEIDADQAQLIAFKAEYRHEHTSYEAEFEGFADDERWYARQAARDIATEDPTPPSWPEYLRTYDFPSPEIAEALSRVLQDSGKCHPVWFAEAIIAVRRAALPLDSLTYDSITRAISAWRNER